MANKRILEAGKKISGLHNKKLFHNTPIKRRTFMGEPIGDYRFPNNKIPKSDFGSSPVQDYNLWYRYLKLLMEMEHNRLSFTKPNISDSKKTDKSVIGKDIKINKIAYMGWDLDKILEGKFSQWWKSHRFLFGKSYTVEMKNKSEWMEGMNVSGNINLTHIRVDIRNSDKDIIKDVKKILKERRGKSISKMKVAGQVQGASFTYLMLSLSYNVMVRHLNGESNFDIFLSENKRIRELCEYNNYRYIDTKIDIKVKGRRLNGKTLWETYTRWNKSKDSSSVVKKTVVYKGETYHLTPSSRKAIDEKNMKSGVDQLIKGILLETQDILLGVSQGAFVKKLKLTYDPKTGKRGKPKV